MGVVGHVTGVGLLLIAVREELVWIDCEMTGLDLKSDRLIEIAVLVTDADLNILGEGIDVVIHAPDDALSGMIEVVAQMHDRSGLTEEVRASTVDVPAAEEMVLDYIRGHVKQAKTAPLAGNSIATDRGFIARDMPALDDYLHYRMIDVSSIKELCRRWYPAHLLRPAGEGSGASRAGRHPRVDPRAAVLPADRVRRPARAVDQRYRRDLRRTEPVGVRRRPNGFGCRASERLISTTPRCPLGQRRWWL